MSFRLSDEFYKKYMQILADNIQSYRKMRRLTQDALSERLGSASKSYLSKLESRQEGADNPTVKFIFCVAEQLRVTPSDLLREHPADENRGQLLETAYNMLNEKMDFATIHRVLPSLTMSEIHAIQNIMYWSSQQNKNL